jgi:benzoate/toluate 1,2-dioxygenase alpha subunit
MVDVRSINLQAAEEKVRNGLLHESSGVDRLSRELFVDEDIFELEMKHLFERGWVFLAHESQLPKPHDFLTTYIGRQPVVLSRNKAGDLNCFVNACAHRGARVCRVKQGNRRMFTCTFHGWVYNNGGELVGVSREQEAAYPAGFEKKSLALPQARLEIHRGFIFGNLAKEGPTLREQHGGALEFIDLLADQSSVGQLEVIPGSTSYTFDGNWKLASENGVDGYHAPYVHESFVAIALSRSGRGADQVKSVDLSSMATNAGGYFYFGGGSACVWTAYANVNDRPNIEMRQEYEAKVGVERAKWMIETQRNLLLFPNMLLSDSASMQIRIIRPLSVNKTEVVTYCIGPVGESAQMRAHRIRQYEDFYNGSGIATPDDLAEFNNCQLGFEARAASWSDLSRGATERIQSTQGWEWAPEFTGMHAAQDTSNEGIFVGIHGDWQAKMLAAIKQERELAE